MDQKATRKKKVTKDFLRRCICITGISILALFGVFQLAQLQIEKVIGPLLELNSIRNEIIELKENEAKYNGYIDITKYSIAIEKKMAERDEKFYHSEDEYIAWLSTRNPALKTLFFAISVIAIIVLEFGTIVAIIMLYSIEIRQYTWTIKRIETVREPNIPKDNVRRNK